MKSVRFTVAGEKHLLTKRGITYNWCGPGTNVSARLQRGDKGIDDAGLDLACKSHDLDYTRAKDWSDVRKADKQFIKNLDKTTIGPKSKKLIKGLFKAKMLGEDIGIVKPSSFTSFPNMQNAVPPKIQEQQPTVNISGQGIFSNNGDPAKKLRSKIKKYRNKKQTDKLMNIAFKSIKKRLKR